MSTTELRPLEIGEILDVAIKTFTKNARTLITIGAIVGIPFELLVGVIQLSTVSSADQVGPLGGLGGGSSSNALTVNPTTGELNPTSGPDPAALAGGLITTLIGLVVTLLLTAATLKAVSDAYLGETPSARESLRFALRRIRSLAWIYVLLGLGFVFALLFFVLPGIWLWVAWSLATPVLLIENLRGSKALRRSFRLVRGRWWPTFAVQLVAALIVGFATAVLVAVVIGIPALVDGSSIVLAVVASTLASTVSVAVVSPLQGAVTAVLYFDLRVRKDGYDLAVLAAQLGLPEAALAGYVLPDGGLRRDAVDAAGQPPPFWPPPPGWVPADPWQARAAAPGGVRDAPAEPDPGHGEQLTPSPPPPPPPPPE